MTDPVSLTVAGLAAGVAVWAGVLSWPRPPTLDGERWFKLTLATLLRGQVEAEGGEVEAWERRVREVVRYHPAGRLPELKVSGDMSERRLPTKAIEGEVALLEALAALPDASARLDWMYREDPLGEQARLADPADLGTEVDPRTWLGKPASWDSVAALGAGDTTMLERVRQRLGATWVVLQGPGVGPELGPAFAELYDATVFEWGEGVEDQVRRVNDWVMATPATPEPRFVLVAQGASIHSLLRVLANSPAIRDHTHAVVSVGSPFAGVDGIEAVLDRARVEDWMGKWFGHHELDTERTFATPYFCVEWMDEAEPSLGAGGWPLAEQRFPTPRWETRTAIALEVVDLGPVLASTEPELVAKALLWMVSGWVALHQ